MGIYVSTVAVRVGESNIGVLVGTIVGCISINVSVDVTVGSGVGLKFAAIVREVIIGVVGLEKLIGVVVLMEDSPSCVVVHDKAKNVAVNRILNIHLLLFDK